jgi:hypothetical protein
MDIRVVILTEHSIYTDGITRRLRGSPHGFDLHVIDQREIDAMEQTAAIQPSAIILENGSAGVDYQCLDGLMRHIPNAKLILIDPSTSSLKVIQWENLLAEGWNDLVKLLEPASLQPLECLPYSLQNPDFYNQKVP